MFCNVVYLDRTPDVSSTQPRKNRFRIVKTGIIGTGRITLRFVGEAKFVSGTNIICAYNLEKESIFKEIQAKMLHISRQGLY